MRTATVVSTGPTTAEVAVASWSSARLAARTRPSPQRASSGPPERDPGRSGGPGHPGGRRSLTSPTQREPDTGDERAHRHEEQRERDEGVGRVLRPWQVRVERRDLLGQSVKSVNTTAARRAAPTRRARPASRRSTAAGAVWPRDVRWPMRGLWPRATAPRTGLHRHGCLGGTGVPPPSGPDPR